MAYSECLINLILGNSEIKDGIRVLSVFLLEINLF